jgi:hypothetical protein
MNPAACQPPKPPAWRKGTAFGLAYYYLTSLVVLLAVLTGATLLVRAYEAPPHQGGFAGHFAYGNGTEYAAIVREGYRFNPDFQSNIAFFPVFPLLGRALVQVTALEPEAALWIVSQVALAAAFVALWCYARLRAPGESPELPDFTLLALGLFPAGVFFRFAYTESVFLLFVVLAMYAMLRAWPLWIAALVVGLATATRATGVALLLPLALTAWQSGGATPRRLFRIAWAVPLGCAGLGAFMYYQYRAFGDPFAFAVAHSHWGYRPSGPWGEKLIALATLEPLWRIYDPSSPVYWAARSPRTPAVLSLTFANPLFVVGAVILTAIGWRKRWLDAKEVALVAGLLLIPYFTRNYEMGMVAGGRFVSVAFPIYLVIGHVLANIPPPLAAALLALSGFFLAIYAAQFAAGYAIA